MTSLVLMSAAIFGAIFACSRPEQAPEGGHNSSAPGTARPEAAWRSGEGLYAVAAGFRHDSSQKRRVAAQELAENGDMAPWVVMLILSSQTSPVGDEAEQYRQAARRRFELAVVAAVVDSLPEEIDHSVLLALTHLLHEEGRGEWGETQGQLLWQVRKSMITQPIRTLARARLKDALGVDHEWDATAWRMEIIKRRE